MTMLERVARAICASTNIALEGVTEVVFDNPDAVYPARAMISGKDTPHWMLYLPKARAAVEAMREPDEKALGKLQEMAVCAGYLREGWQAAIDSILSEQEAG